jgi:hypothetical protein
MKLFPLADAAIYWHLPLLMVIVSLVYSATRYEDWPAILREALRWGLRMSFFLVFVGALLFFLATFIG